MPAVEETSGCWGFDPGFLKVGNGYASRLPGGSRYFTAICSHTQFAAMFEDIAALGAGREPKKSKASPAHGAD